MARRKIATGVAALLACAAALAACERYPAPTTPDGSEVLTSVAESTSGTTSETTGETTSETTSETTAEPTRAAGSPTASPSRRPEGVVGSPIDVPTIPSTGQPLEDVREGILAEFREACGTKEGEPLCVRLVFTDDVCFAGYEPSGKAARGSRVTVLTSPAQDCGLEPTDEPTSDEPTTDEPSTGATSEPDTVATDEPASGST
jgi:hypothetical protein